MKTKMSGGQQKRLQIPISLLAAGSMFAFVGSNISTSLAQDLEEVVVTARKREERIQDVPVAVTALTAEIIEQQKPRTLQDLQGLAPNVFIGMNPATNGQAAIFIRGLGYSGNEKTQNPAVGLMIDDVFLGVNTGALIDSFDMQQVEIDRGPQGLFEGKNTTGGLIKVTRSRPTMDWGFKGSASYGNYDEVILRGILNAPIVKDIAGLKLGYSYKNHEGYWDNVYGGPSNGDVDASSFNAELLLKLADSVEALFVFDYVRDRSEITPVSLGSGIMENTFGLPNNPANLKPLEVLNDYPERGHLDFFRGSGEINVETAIGRFTSVTGYIKEKDQTFQDFDATCVTDLGGLGCPSGNLNLLLAGAGGTLHTQRTGHYKQLTQELRLQTKFTDRVDGLFGAYYYKHDIDHKQLTALFDNVMFTRQESGEENQVFNGFANIAWNVTDALSLSGGARYLHEEKKFDSVFKLIPFNDAVFVGPIHDEKDWNRVVTRVDVGYKITPEHLAYFSRSEGFRSGGFSMRGTLSEQIAGETNCPNPGVPGTVACPGNNFLSFNPEDVTSYEIGLKNEFFDRSLTLNLAAFLTNLKGLQYESIVVTPFGPGTNTYINNLQKARIKGFEAELTVRPDFLPGFTLSGAFGYQKYDIKKAEVDSRRLPVGPGGTAGSSGTTDVSDSTFLYYSPNFNYALTATYTRTIGSGEFSAATTWKYTDDVVLWNVGPITDVQKGYGLLDASLAYAFGHCTVSLFAHNILDKAYRTESLPTVYFQTWGQPFTIAGELSVRF